MTRHFLWAELCDPEILMIVLGRDVQIRCVAAHLDDFCLVQAPEYPALRLARRRGCSVNGVLVDGLEQVDFDRISHFLNASSKEQLPVQTEHGAIHATVVVDGDAEGSPVEFSGEHIGVAREAAIEWMGYFAQVSPRYLAQRYVQIQARARARCAALNHAPRGLRTGRGAIELKELRRPYVNFFALEERDYVFAKFNGKPSEVVSRAGFISPDAATVLPYDPLRDVVLLIEQLRFGPMLRGDPIPWQIEAIAGHVNDGETPEETAYREALEEADLALLGLEKVGGYYSTPGAMSEYVTSFVGIADLTGYCESLHGLVEEAEDIRAFVVPFERLQSALESGEVDNGPLLISTLWLKVHRPRLRESAGGA